LSIQGALAVGDEAGPIKKWLIQARKHGESVARRRFERAEGELGTNADPAALASYFATLLQGLCVQAAGGATKAEMTKIVDTALHYMGIQDGSRTNPKEIQVRRPQRA
jgi:hypothetical protein